MLLILVLAILACVLLAAPAWTFVLRRLRDWADRMIFAFFGTPDLARARGEVGCANCQPAVQRPPSAHCAAHFALNSDTNVGTSAHDALVGIH